MNGRRKYDHIDMPLSIIGIGVLLALAFLVLPHQDTFTPGQNAALGVLCIVLVVGGVGYLIWMHRRKP